MTIQKQYVLFLGDAPDPLAAKVAQCIKDWRPGYSVSQITLPGCKADMGLKNINVKEAINLGADDVIINIDKSVEIITAPNDFTKINEGLEKLGFKKELAELTMKAENEINLKDDDALKMQKILDILEDLDDVQEVYTNANFED